LMVERLGPCKSLYEENHSSFGVVTRAIKRKCIGAEIHGLRIIHG
jgi:hypothetical protein